MVEGSSSQPNPEHSPRLRGRERYETPEILGMIASLRSLPAELGFNEPDVMSEVRESAVKAIRDGEPDTVERFYEYQDIAMLEIDRKPADDKQARAEAKIGLRLQLGLMRWDGGDVQRFLTDLVLASNHALAVQRPDITELVHTTIEKLMELMPDIGYAHEN